MSSPVVTIIDYGMGNLLSVCRGLEKCGAKPILSKEPDQIAEAEMLILPGVGAFADGMAELERRNLIDPIQAAVNSARPLLGICLGMQMLMESSEEFGSHNGLGLLAGTVAEIPAHGADGQPHKIPHMGWAPLLPVNGDNHLTNPLLNGIIPGSAVYFVHSYHVMPKIKGDLAATTDYDGIAVTAMVTRKNVFGCQFHPEKSGRIGLQILGNFLGLPR